MKNIAREEREEVEIGGATRKKIRLAGQCILFMTTIWNYPINKGARLGRTKMWSFVQ